MAKTTYPRREFADPDPDPAPAPAPARENGPERWARWKMALDSGAVASRAELARREGVTRAAVTQGLKKLAGM